MRGTVHVTDSNPAHSGKTSVASDARGGAVLSAERLVVRAGGRVLIGPLDFRLGVGERVGILGPSGCGKSQLLDRLMGLIPLRPGEGQVRLVRGGSASPRAPGSARGASGESPVFSAVFQANALFDILTVRENVAVGARDSISPDAVDQAIRAVALDPVRDGEKFPAELSGGMQRRVALARALMATPDLLVLDEPLVGLDGESRRIVREAVEQAHRDSGGTMAALVVTHDYDFAAAFCDRMLWIDPQRRQLEEMADWPGADPGQRVARIQGLLKGEGRAGNAGEPGTGDGRPDSKTVRPSGGWGRILSPQGMPLGETLRLLADSLGDFPALAGAFLHGPQSGVRPWRDALEQWVRACVLAVPYVALLFALVGFLLVLQSERLLAPLGMGSRIPEAVTVGIVQGVGPLLLVLIMAGRTGSAMAADLGGQRLSRQVEMWRLVGRDPRVVLFSPRAWALLVAFPLLLLLAEFVALGAGWLFYATAIRTGLTATGFWEGVKSAWDLGPTVGGMVRAALDGWLLAVIAYWFGTAPKRGAEDVAEASTGTVVAASLAFLVVEVGWTMVFGGVRS